MTRLDTPDRHLSSGGKRIRIKRACNGCGHLLGDATDEEIEATVNGRALPDVRSECPNCKET